MSVLKQFHNLGIGSMMIETLLKAAIKMGKNKMELDVRIDNYAEIRLYKRYGFYIEGTIKNGFFIDNHYIELYQMRQILEA
ncbi:MAG: GNAT family N-acetyltransferase [Candidatus Izemoplasma sp.]|nr:GNAT family N-acetyltransferase [Candidatus Izemoplasma sp.]